MTIAQDWKIRTFVRENTPRWYCSYHISATGAAGTPDRATHQQNLYSMLYCMAYSIYRADECQICFTFFESITSRYHPLNIHNTLLYMLRSGYWIAPWRVMRRYVGGAAALFVYRRSGQAPAAPRCRAAKRKAMLAAWPIACFGSIHGT